VSRDQKLRWKWVTLALDVGERAEVEAEADVLERCSWCFRVGTGLLRDIWRSATTQVSGEVGFVRSSAIAGCVRCVDVFVRM
jgi:hypothetical protein